MEDKWEHLQRYAWQYFEIHANQRLTTFNFYITLSTLLATGMFATFSKDFTYPQIGVFAGALLMSLSIVFWRLDRRNRELIKNAENALRAIEDKFSKEYDAVKLKLFIRDDIATDGANGCRFLCKYSSCFNVVFLLFGISGIVGMVVTFTRG